MPKSAAVICPFVSVNVLVGSRIPQSHTAVAYHGDPNTSTAAVQFPRTCQTDCDDMDDIYEVAGRLERDHSVFLNLKRRDFSGAALAAAAAWETGRTEGSFASPCPFRGEA
jgi:hypothetical protein